MSYLLDLLVAIGEALCRHVFCHKTGQFVAS
jgi:hypothetical protein